MRAIFFVFVASWVLFAKSDSAHSIDDWELRRVAHVKCTGNACDQIDLASNICFFNRRVSGGSRWICNTPPGTRNITTSYQVDCDPKCTLSFTTHRKETRLDDTFNKAAFAGFLGLTTMVIVGIWVSEYRSQKDQKIENAFKKAIWLPKAQQLFAENKLFREFSTFDSLAEIQRAVNASDILWKIFQKVENKSSEKEMDRFQSWYLRHYKRASKSGSKDLLALLIKECGHPKFVIDSEKPFHFAFDSDDEDYFSAEKDVKMNK